MEGLLLSLDVFFMILLLVAVIRRGKGSSSDLGFFSFLSDRKETTKK
ncbi:MAG: hypothetical protein LBQ62_01250 [Candidatus Accumulibacter sp.]|jgi:uncharacterized membrane protein|nr:hypothetical protein [Accumulibacter sp.]